MKIDTSTDSLYAGRNRGKALRNRRRRKNTPPGCQKGILLIVVLALVVPVSVNYLRHQSGLLAQTGEKAAMLAAVAGMPEAGLELLRERFRSELYTEGEHGEAQQPVEDLSMLIPQAPEEPQQDEPPTERENPVRAQPQIPEAYRAEIISESFSIREAGGTIIRHLGGFIRNDCGMTNEEIEEILAQPMALTFEDTDEPQVLIVHTHATEAFERYDSEYYDTRNTWRSRDNNLNMVSVGAAMQRVLEENGIGVLHDTTQHDYPSYNGSYERSAETVKSYLEQYPGIKVVLDLHRDAMERENAAIVKPVAEIDGQKAAQVMIISACDDDGNLGVPEFRENLRFAAVFQSYMESAYPELTRPVLFSYRKYNMDLTTGSLLLEFGSNANTLEEAVYAAQLAGQALAELIHDYS